MKLKHLVAVAGTAALLTSVSGCTETTTGNPAVSSTGTTSQAGDSSTAPKVANPLTAIASYTSKPCDLVPTAMITQLGYSNPDPSNATSAIGPGCGWIDVRTSKGRNINVAIGILNGKGNGGIAKIYTLNGSLFSFVEPTEVSGYPAAYADGSDLRSKGKCEIWVGATDDVTFSVNADGYSGAQDSCDTAKQIAAAVITKLQGGS
jgi:hypothetical protein